ncbi:probable DNA double-strand break repair Rad50 ATPase [Saccostrea echinata]|uniref:probable DNA double-strand break repair Rad50 ATPase n=1 Tax=Saccostrea echinata TaxID=191078 RepID=UPI002A8152DB|nr:probable DNA double-strand break repair Rad50 ATPase [Saccostrea echinata]
MQKEYKDPNKEKIEEEETANATLQEEKHPEEEDLTRAVQESEKQQSILPLVKQELNYKIRFKRLSEGKEEFVHEEPKQHHYELTEYEKQKIEERRRQNRQSAQRSRKRSEDYEQTLKQRINNLSKENIELSKERDQLRKAKEKLLLEFRKVGCFPSARVCSCGVRLDTSKEVSATETRPSSE